MFRHPAKIKRFKQNKAAIDVSPFGEDEGLGQTKVAVDISPSGEEIEIQAKQSTDYCFACPAKMEDSGKAKQRLLFRHSARNCFII